MGESRSFVSRELRVGAGGASRGGGGGARVDVATRHSTWYDIRVCPRRSVCCGRGAAGNLCRGFLRALLACGVDSTRAPPRQHRESLLNAEGYAWKRAG